MSVCSVEKHCRVCFSVGVLDRGEMGLGSGPWGKRAGSESVAKERHRHACEASA